MIALGSKQRDMTMSDTHREQLAGESGGFLRVLFTGWAVICLLGL